MSTPKLTIRNSRETERVAIFAVHNSAFGEEQGLAIVQLVNDLLDDETAAPMLSLVAELRGELVGHVLFTSVTIESTEEPVSSQILAPLAVMHDRQRQGVGGMLIREGLKRLKESGVALVFVLGSPEYEAKFGFQPARAHGLQSPHPIAAEHADAWMATELTPGAIAKCGGTVRCSRVLNQPQHWQE